MTITLPENARGPILDLTLPVSAEALDIVLRNATTGKTLTIKLPAAWAGDDLSLDWYRRTIRDQNGADRSALLSATDNGLWTDPPPLITGVNDVEIEVLRAVVATAFMSPGTVETATLTGGAAGPGEVNWTNPSNVKASDNARATVAVGFSLSYYLKALNYAFGLPEGATPTGAELDVERLSPAGSCLDYEVRLIKGGAISNAVNRASPDIWPVAEAIKVYGGASDLWGTTISRAEANSATTGFAISVTKGGALLATEPGIDHMKARIFYRPAASAYGAVAKLRWEKGYY